MILRDRFVLSITPAVRNAGKIVLKTQDKKQTSKEQTNRLIVTKQSAENRRKECYQFWLRLHHTVILILNDRTSASKKTNRMALIRTLTVPAIAFERKKEELYGFQQTAKTEQFSVLQLPKTIEFFLRFFERSSRNS